MKIELLPEEIAFFESLRNSATGAKLKHYLERMIDDMCDLRTMTTISGTEIKARREAADALEDSLIRLLK